MALNISQGPQRPTKTPVNCYNCGQFQNKFVPINAPRAEMRVLCDQCKNIGHLADERSEMMKEHLKEYFANHTKMGLDQQTCTGCGVSIAECTCAYSEFPICVGCGERNNNCQCRLNPLSPRFSQSALDEEMGVIEDEEEIDDYDEEPAEPF